MTRRRASPTLTRSLNALRHGLTATTTLLPGELAEDHARLLQAAADALTTYESSTFARALAQRAGELLWRLRRIQQWETALLEPDPDTAPVELDRVARYESHLTRQLHATITILATIQPPAIPRDLDAEVLDTLADLARRT